MHEVSVAERVVEIALSVARENGGRRLTAARLVLGGLTCLDPETLAFAFGVVSRGTPAEGCSLDIARVPGRLRCRSCQLEQERELADPCPECGAAGGEILTGRVRGWRHCELAEASSVTMLVEEQAIPVAAPVRAACELMGLDPLYLACEGRAVLIVAAEAAPRVLRLMRALPEGELSTRIGEVAAGEPRVVARTAVGGHRLINVLSADPLPRIC